MFVKHCKVEVYLLELNLCENDNMDNVVTRHFSKADTIGEGVHGCSMHSTLHWKIDGCLHTQNISTFSFVFCVLKKKKAAMIISKSCKSPLSRYYRKGDDMKKAKLKS